MIHNRFIAGCSRKFTSAASSGTLRESGMNSFGALKCLTHLTPKFRLSFNLISRIQRLARVRYILSLHYFILSMEIFPLSSKRKAEGDYFRPTDLIWSTNNFTIKPVH